MRFLHFAWNQRDVGPNAHAGVAEEAMKSLGSQAEISSEPFKTLVEAFAVAERVALWGGGAVLVGGDDVRETVLEAEARGRGARARRRR